MMADALRLETFMELRLGSPAGQFRAVPVKLGSGGPPAFFAELLERVTRN